MVGGECQGVARVQWASRRIDEDRLTGPGAGGTDVDGDGGPHGALRMSDRHTGFGIM